MKNPVSSTGKNSAYLSHELLACEHEFIVDHPSWELLKQARVRMYVHGVFVLHRLVVSYKGPGYQGNGSNNELSRCRQMYSRIWSLLTTTMDFLHIPPTLCYEGSLASAPSRIRTEVTQRTMLRSCCTTSISMRGTNAFDNFTILLLPVSFYEAYGALEHKEARPGVS